MKIRSKAFPKSFRALAGAALLSAMAVAPAAAADKGEFEAIAVWRGSATAVQASNDTAVAVGVVEGIMFIQGNKGFLHMAKMTCPLMMKMDAKLKQKGTGTCLMIGESGDRAFAEWTCEGEASVGCKGVIKLVGGTGKLKGIVGEGPFVFRSSMHRISPEDDGVTQDDAMGIAAFEMNYEIK